MAWWIIVGLFALINIASIVYAIWDRFWGRSPFVFMVSAFTAGMAMAVVGGVYVHDEQPTVQSLHSRTPLSALSNSSDIRGNFFLGTGYVDSELTLTYVTKDRGYYELKSMPAYRALVHEGGSTPELDVYHTYVVDPWLWPWPMQSDDVTVFRVPEGTVAQKFNVDVTK